MKTETSSSIARSSNRNSFNSYRKRRSSPISPSLSSVVSASSPACAAPASGPSRSIRNLPKKRYSPTSKPALAQAQPIRQAPKRRQSIPATSTSTGKNREFEALIEREYQEDVLAYMAEMEDLTQANVELIDQQPELQWYMRPYLIDFLVEIHAQYHLRPETLYLAVNIADRYTSKRIVYKRHYQLVGCAALWIAAKFEDQKDRVPTVQDLVAMTCSAYDASAFLQMEGHVLSTLGWLLGHPTAESWLRAAALDEPSMLTYDTKVGHVARFLMEITLFHRAFIAIKPSDIAKGCLLLARYLLGKPRKPSDENQMAIQIAQMLDGHLAEHLESISTILFKKYALPCFSNASTFVQESYLSGARFDLFSWPLPTVSTTMLTPPSYMLRRTSSCASSVVSSSPSSYSNSPGGRSSSDEDEAPLTPGTPLTPWQTEEQDPMLARRPSLTKIMKRQRLHAHNGSPLNLMQTSSPLAVVPEVQEKDTFASLKVNLVPDHGPVVPLC